MGDGVGANGVRSDDTESVGGEVSHGVGLVVYCASLATDRPNRERLGPGLSQSVT